MESGFTSLSSSAKSPSYLMACKPWCSTNQPFPRPPAPAQPPLLPLPAHLQLQASPQYHPSWPATASRSFPRDKKPSPKKTTGASAPIVGAAASKKRTATTAERPEVVEWTSTDSLYSVSPPPSSVPMPTSLLIAAGRKLAPTACAMEVAGGGGVDVGATDELRRLLGL